ncbi:MAG: hypothetical protein NXI31_10135 [bacterium]|nr:hypothetical protein [bacterium]
MSIPFVSRTLRTVIALSLAIVPTTSLPTTSLRAQTPQILSTGSGPGARHPIVALDADAVFWVAMPNGQRELFVAATDGSPPSQLTTGADLRVGHGTFDQWSPIATSDDGDIVAYWNSLGVHVLDRQASTDVVVAPATLLAMPRLDAAGSRVVYQDLVAGELEVFLVDATGSNPPVQLTNNSGAGRRLPMIRGDLVLFQKLVGREMELFVHDLSTSTTSSALTSGSGGGNRHGRLTPNADAVVFEAVVGGEQTVMRLDLGSSTITTIGGAASGSRIAATDGDEQVVLQTGTPQPLVELHDPAITTLTSGSRGGHRLPQLDRHGQLVVWQEEHQGNLEVFAVRRAWPAVISQYGTAGTPSSGTLQPTTGTYRLQQSVGIDTQLPSGTPAVFAVGFTPQNVPISGAPGNFQLLTPIASVVVFLDGQGDTAGPVPLAATLLGFQYHAQFAVLDPTANPLGLVTSAGFTVAVP